MDGAEVKAVRTRHIQTQVNNMMQSWTWGISIGNNIGKAATENTIVYTIRILNRRSWVQIPTGF
jgi:hypothetical protein